MRAVADSPRLIDTHLHLDLYVTPNKVLEEAKSNDLGLVAITNAPFLFEPCKKLCDSYRFVWPALGMHPQLSARYASQMDLFEDLLGLTPFIGEIGLDYSEGDKDEHCQQRIVFERILSACADARNKILSIHSRNAVRTILDSLGKDYPGLVVMHWYSGSLSSLETAIERDFYFSINRSMVASKKGQSIVQHIPATRMFLESDGPFIKDGHDLEAVIAGIAKLKRTNVATIKAHIDQNNERIIEAVSRFF